MAYTFFMSSNKRDPMIQERVGRHLNSPYYQHALAQKPKDCPNQKKVNSAQVQV